VEDKLEESLIQIWMLKSDMQCSTYAMLNEYDEIQVNDWINALCEAYPEITKSIDKDKLKQFISLNISNLYNYYGNTSED
jgi:hypothetical protein